MNAFPMLDPIPLPAPVWIFKSLHMLTLTLHFVAMQVFLGSLCLAAVLTAIAGKDPIRKGAAAALARRLPAILTFVINLGVPPLLFSQVLYGPALYTSSVLIAVYWFAVVILLATIYWTLYKFADGINAGKNMAARGFLALFLAYAVSKIYTLNMTLMLRPEVWQDMYAATASGQFLPPHDPTVMPRWLFMITGSFWVGGMWMVWVAGLKNIETALSQYLATVGSRLAVGMILVQSAILYWVVNSQPEVVKQGLSASLWLTGAQVGWCVCALMVLGFAAITSIRRASSPAIGYAGAFLTVVIWACWVVVRDGIRDITLASKGYDVWSQAVVTNWGVVGVFAGTFLVGLIAIGWLIAVMLKARPVAEGGIA